MKQLRLVTILATWLLMFFTMVVPVGFFSIQEGYYLSPHGILYGLTVWIFYGSPLLVSGIISHFLKRTVPLVILLLSTIGYGIAACFMLYIAAAAFDDSCAEDGIEFVGVAPVSLVFLIPIWVIALILNVIGKKEMNH